jgi:hypothetical protein
MRTIRAFALIGALVAAGCSGGPEPPPFKVVADNKLLMQAILDPAADELWESVGWIITAEGTEEVYPRTDEEWIKVRNAAVAVIESGNLLMMAPRAKDNADWIRISQGLIETGQSAMSAIEAKDRDKVFTVGGDVYDVCTACHAKYSPEVTGIRP